MVKKEVGQYPALKNNDYGEKFVSILNAKVDLVTLKLLGFLMGQLKLNSLKMSNSAFTEAEADDFKRILEKDGTFIRIQIVSLRFTLSGTLSLTTPEDNRYS